MSKDRLTDIGNKLVVAKGEGDERDGVGVWWEQL